jgi:hypothetical protein
LRSVPFKMAAARAASSGIANFTKPKPRETPSADWMMEARLTGPMPPQSSSRSVVVALNGRLRTKMDLYRG